MTDELGAVPKLRVIFDGTEIGCDRIEFNKDNFSLLLDRTQNCGTEVILKEVTNLIIEPWQT